MHLALLYWILECFEDARSYVFCTLFQAKRRVNKEEKRRKRKEAADGDLSGQDRKGDGRAAAGIPNFAPSGERTGL